MGCPGALHFYAIALATGIDLKLLDRRGRLQRVAALVISFGVAAVLVVALLIAVMGAPTGGAPR